MDNKILSKTDLPKIVTVSRIIKEGKDIKSVIVSHSQDYKPGQFFMIWVPGLDQKPYAPSYHTKKEIGFTCHVRGKFSKAFVNLKKGAKIGMSGPYGNHFSVKRDACVVAGGIGIALLSPLIPLLKNPKIIYGSRSKEYLIFLKRLKSKNTVIMTDDGSYGRKGFTTDALGELLKSDKKIKIVYTCGPEIMMKKVLEICNRYKVECEASLERFMSCGFGICGKCDINGRLVCLDGTIFNSKQLNKMSEFGNIARLKSGRKVSLKEFYNWHSK